jgi:hypothetical protein
MPEFLEKKLKAEYGQNSKIPYKVMNSIGAMRGNQETAKGKHMEAKHEAEMPMHEMRIEIHRGPGGAVTGHTVHHQMMPKKTKSAAFMEETHHSFPFDAAGQSSSHGDMMDHIAEHLGMTGGEGNDGEHAEGGEVAPETGANG